MTLLHARIASSAPAQPPATPDGLVGRAEARYRFQFATTQTGTKTAGLIQKNLRNLPANDPPMALPMLCWRVDVLGSDFSRAGMVAADLMQWRLMFLRRLFATAKTQVRPRIVRSLSAAFSRTKVIDVQNSYFMNELSLLTNLPSGHAPTSRVSGSWQTFIGRLMRLGRPVRSVPHLAQVLATGQFTRIGAASWK